MDIETFSLEEQKEPPIVQNDNQDVPTQEPSPPRSQSVKPEVIDLTKIGRKRAATSHGLPKTTKKQKNDTSIFERNVNLESLIDSDPLNRKAQLPGQPTPSWKDTTTWRSEAMKELLASNADRQEVRELDEACKIFGPQQMKIAGDRKFQHQRMKTVCTESTQDIEP